MSILRRVAQPIILRVPLDKREGVVKRNFSWAVGEHRWLRPWLAKLRSKTQEISRLISSRWNPSFHQPSIRSKRRP